MVINIRSFISRLGIVLLFILLTLFFHMVISKILDIISPPYQYKRPSGKVIEVDLQYNVYPINNFKETLYYFWLEGE